MRRFLFLLTLILVFSSPVPAAEDLMYTNDMWDSYGSSINEGQKAKPVTDEEFEKAVKQKDAKVNKWRNWAQKRKIPKGENFSKSNETEVLKKEHGEDKSLPIISLPFEISLSQGVIPVGHYQVKGEIIDGKPVLNFYQASDLVARISATETNDDFNQEEILFANWELVDDNTIRLIYGSLDFNAYAIVEIINN